MRILSYISVQVTYKEVNLMCAAEEALHLKRVNASRLRQPALSPNSSSIWKWLKTFEVSSRNPNFTILSKTRSKLFLEILKTKQLSRATQNLQKVQTKTSRSTQQTQSSDWCLICDWKMRSKKSNYICKIPREVQQTLEAARSGCNSNWMRKSGRMIGRRGK